MGVCALTLCPSFLRSLGFSGLPSLCFFCLPLLCSPKGWSVKQQQLAAKPAHGFCLTAAGQYEPGQGYITARRPGQKRVESTNRQDKEGWAEIRGSGPACPPPPKPPNQLPGPCSPPVSPKQTTQPLCLSHCAVSAVPFCTQHCIHFVIKCHGPLSLNVIFANCFIITRVILMNKNLFIKHFHIHWHSNNIVCLFV